MKHSLSVLMVLICGCGSTDLFFASLSEPVEVDGALLYLDTSSSSVILVDPEGRAGPNRNRSLARVQVGERSTRVVPAPSPDAPESAEALVVDPGAQALFVVHDRSGAFTRVDVGLPVDELAVSSQGRYAVAFQREDSTFQQTLFSFPNAVSVIDLGADPPSAATFELGSGGVRPRAVRFSDPFDIQVSNAAELSVATLEIALVFVDGGIIPIDLRNGVSGPLVSLSATGDVRPIDVEFSNNRGDNRVGSLDGAERAYVRGEDGQLFVLSVSAVDIDNTVRPLLALENVVTPDRPVFDFELFFSDDGRDLLLAAVGDQVVLVDGETGVAERFPVPGDVRRLRGFMDPGLQRRLAFGFASGGDAIYRLDPFALDRRRAAGIETIALGAPVADVTVSANSNRAVLMYENQRELGLLDLAGGQDLIDLRFALGIQTMAMEPDGERLLVVGLDPVESQPRLAAVELNGLGAVDVAVARFVQGVGSTETHVWVNHVDAVTFFPRNNLTEDSGRVFRDLSYTQILNLPVEGDD